MATGKEMINPPTARALKDASKELRRRHPSGGRTMADAAVAKREGVRRRKEKRNAGRG